MSTRRTFDAYVESYVIRPVVSLLNALRRIPQYPTLHYHLKADPHGKLLFSFIIVVLLLNAIQSLR
jgi:hypothetical protein